MAVHRAESTHSTQSEFGVAVRSSHHAGFSHVAVRLGQRAWRRGGARVSLSAIVVTIVVGDSESEDNGV